MTLLQQLGSYLRENSTLVGQIIVWGSPNIPKNFLVCDGRELLISDYQKLFEVIGNSYGGDAVSTFALPDFQDRVPVGASADIRLGSYRGASNVALSTENMPVHGHSAEVAISGEIEIPVSTSMATLVAPSGLSNLAAANNSYDPIFMYTDSAPDASLRPFAPSISGIVGISPAGFETPEPISLINPQLAVKYLIAFNGIKPVFS